MQSLKELQLPSILDTSTNDLVKDFFSPVLSNSLRYDRGVGFFSSGWIKLNCKGMLTFANNGGRARWVTSPILAETDWDAIYSGNAAKNDATLKAIIEENVRNLADNLEEDILSFLAWLIADEVVSFKLALPKHKLDKGDFHDKFGIFEDIEGNKISFSGSYNDSIQGTRNYESIKIFKSWEPFFTQFVDADSVRFEKLWGNLDPNVQVYDLPEAVKEQILQIRTGERPYTEPEWVRLSKKHQKFGSSPKNLMSPKIPSDIVLRDYQNQAIQAWLEHDHCGLLEMATGTGKTITSLAASVRVFEEQKKLALIIAVPYQHLVTQWSEDAKRFGYQPVLAYQSKTRWLNELNKQIIEYNSSHRSTVLVITTHTTFISTEFQGSIAKLKVPSMLIADEAHHLGAERSRQDFPVQIPFRMALSATPERWFDDVGTTALFDYFGETVFSFPLEKAIGVSLTNYYYYPNLVTLTDDELVSYQELSLKIARVISKNDEDSEQVLKMLLLRRANLLNEAQNKLTILSKLVDKQQENLDHALFYCSPGQIDSVMEILGWEKGLLVHTFTAEEDIQERKQILHDFSQGTLQALVAMRCLDEGVDVPNTKMAFILASSSNPREFIQRRGRILRKSSEKEYSVIYDLIAVPPSIWQNSSNSVAFDTERGIVRRELQRFKEFANPALNKHEALDVIWDVARHYGLLDSLAS